MYQKETLEHREQRLKQTPTSNVFMLERCPLKQLHSIDIQCSVSVSESVIEIKVTLHANCLECNELDQTTSIGQPVR